MAKDARAADLAKIHLAVKQIGMSDPDYRLMLFEHFGVISSASLDGPKRQALLALLIKRGATVSLRRAPSFHPARTTKDNPKLRKIRALLATAGKPMSYGDALALRLAKVERLEWCTDAGLNKVLAALVIHSDRSQR